MGQRVCEWGRQTHSMGIKVELELTSYTSISGINRGDRVGDQVERKQYMCANGNRTETRKCDSSPVFPTLLVVYCTLMADCANAAKEEWSKWWGPHGLSSSWYWLVGILLSQQILPLLLIYNTKFSPGACGPNLSDNRLPRDKGAPVGSTSCHQSTSQTAAAVFSNHTCHSGSIASTFYTLPHLFGCCYYNFTFFQQFLGLVSVSDDFVGTPMK